jgi:hypothetical protein
MLTHVAIRKRTRNVKILVKNLNSFLIASLLRWMEISNERCGCAFFDWNDHTLYQNVTLNKSQIIILGLKYRLSFLALIYAYENLTRCGYFTNDSDALSVCILRSRENDSRSSLVTDFLDVDSLSTNQELVMLRLSFHLPSMQ